MDRQTVILNLVNNYGKYGLTEAMINELINSGLEYDYIYLSLDAELSKRYGQEFYCTSQDMARAFGVTEDEINRVIEESREELLASGENTDDYFRTITSTTFMM